VSRTLAWVLVLAALFVVSVLAVLFLDAPAWVIVAACAPAWIVIRVLRYQHFRSPAD
jgi:hypothetical protein